MNNYIIKEEECDINKCKIPSKGKLGLLVSEEYNSTQELIAFGYENGTVLVKRHGWKTCWKKDLSTEIGLDIKLFQEETEKDSVKLCCLTWSPDGEMLIANMSDGKMHLLWTESGKIAYSYQSKNIYKQMKWIKFGNIYEEKEMKLNDINCVDFATSDRFNFNEEATKRASSIIMNLNNFLMEKIPHDYADTLVIGIQEDSVIVDLYCSGILYFKSIDAAEGYEFNQYTDTFSLEVIDCDISRFSLPRFYIGFKVVEYGSEITINKETHNNNSQQVSGYSIYTACVDLGLATNDLWIIVKITLLYSKMLYLTVFLREMAQYTFARIDEKIGTFYEQSLNELIRSYKLYSLSKTLTFFHEIINHLCGKKVTSALKEVFKKGKGAQQCVQILEDFCYNKMKNFGTGLQLMSMTADVMKSISINILEIFHRKFLYKCDKSLIDGIPDDLKEFLNFYSDIAVLQNKIEEISEILFEKKDKLTMLCIYLTEMVTSLAAGDESHSLPRINYETVDPFKLIEFIEETVLLNDLELDEKNDEIVKTKGKVEFYEELINFMKPLGFYHLPHYYLLNTTGCPHQYKPRRGELKRFIEKVQSNNEDIKDNYDHMINVYSWKNEKYFDFLSKYFPEYTSSGFPPEKIKEIEKEKLMNTDNWKELLPQLKSKPLFKNLPCHQYLKDEDIVKKLILRPTIFLSMIPVFNFHDVVTQFLKNHYPCRITKTVHKIEQCNTLGGPLLMKFLSTETEIEKLLGKQMKTVANGYYFLNKNGEIEDENDEVMDTMLMIMPKNEDKVIQNPICIGVVFMIHSNCVGRLAFIFKEYEFVEKHYNEIDLIPSILEPKTILWRDAMIYMNIKAAKIKLNDETIVIIGNQIDEIDTKLMYYQFKKNDLTISDVKIDENSSLLFTRKDSNSVVLIDENKEHGYWLQKVPQIDEDEKAKHPLLRGWRRDANLTNIEVTAFLRDVHQSLY